MSAHASATFLSALGSKLPQYTPFFENDSSMGSPGLFSSTRLNNVKTLEKNCAFVDTNYAPNVIPIVWLHKVDIYSEKLRCF